MNASRSVQSVLYNQRLAVRAMLFARWSFFTFAGMPKDALGVILALAVGVLAVVLDWLRYVE